MVAPTMQLERHERGIHVVSAEPERAAERQRVARPGVTGTCGMAGRSKSGSASSPAASAAVNQIGFSADRLAAGQLALTPSS